MIDKAHAQAHAEAQDAAQDAEDALPADLAPAPATRPFTVVFTRHVTYRCIAYAEDAGTAARIVGDCIRAQELDEIDVTDHGLVDVRVTAALNPAETDQ